MQKIFISWGSEEKEVVNYVKGRFKKNGLKFFEYSDEMYAGENIVQRVQNEIDSSIITIVCLSDSACARKWVISEVTMLYLAKQNNKLKEIIPIQVGSLNLDNLPPTMEGKYKYIPDVFN